MPDEDAADPIAHAWDEVDRAWEDPEAHRRFLALSRALGRLPEAGRRYREARDSDPARRASAQRRIEELLAAATLEMELHRSPRPTTRDRRRTTLVALLLTLGLFAAIASAWSLRG